MKGPQSKFGSDPDGSRERLTTSMNRRWSVLADVFQQYRLKAGLSFEELASRLDGVTADQLRAFESGGTPIPLEEIFSLTNALNIPPEAIMAILYDDFQGS